MSFFFLYIFIVLVFWRPQEWLIPWLFGIPLLQGITYMAMLAMMMEYQTGKLRLNFKEPQYFLFWGLFFAGCMSHISWGYFAGLMASWQALFRLTFFGILLFGCTNSVSHLRWIARAFVVMAILMAIHGILQISQGYGFAGHRPIMSWRPNVSYLVPRARFFGIFGDPNDMGQFLVAAMPLTLVMFKKRRMLQVVIAAGIIAFLYRGFTTTLSRGSLIGLAASAGIAVVMLIFKKKFLYGLGFGLLGALLFIPFSGRFLGDAWERVNLWGDANYAWRTRPIFGVGLFMIRDYTFESKAVHNAYVSCYAEIGAFGFFFWFSLIFVAALGLVQTRIALRNATHSEGKYLYDFSMWGLASLAGFAASAFFLSRAFIFPLYFLTAMMGAVPYLAKSYVPEGEVHKLGFSIKETVILGIPISLMAISYVYVSIVVLNMQR